MALALSSLAVLISFSTFLTEIVSTQEFLPGDVYKKLCNANTAGLCEYYGYKSEEHTVTTEDGYILTVFRCYKNLETIKKVVILHHGTVSSSDDFVMNIPSQALAYLLADSGYDVWMLNSRGNYYSRRHTTKDPDYPHSGFFNFSWDEIALFDYPAVYEYVLKKTGVAKFYAIGHSRGSTALLALLSKRPEYNKYMNAVSLMSPVAYLSHASMVARFFTHFQQLWGRFVENREFLPRGGSKSFELLSVLGKGFLKMFPPSEGINKTMYSVYQCHGPSGTSSNELIHFGQIINRRTFASRYNRNIKPSALEVYRLDQITAPLSLHYSMKDFLTNPKDVDRLIDELKGQRELHVQVIDEKYNFGHADFMLSKYAAELVYSDVMNFLQKH